MKRINFILFFLLILLVSFTFLYSQQSTGQTSSSSSSSSGEEETECKCPSGFRFDTTSCIQGGGNIACTLIFAPVCGCDGMTYSNGCFANANGIKKFTAGECNSSSSSSGLICISDDDCPPGICSSSGTFKNYSCLNGTCNKIFYFADPCQFQSSSSGSLILSKNFNGLWKGKILSCNDGSVSQNDMGSNCVICPQIAILCAKGFTFIPQTCHKCGHCAKCTDFKKATLSLCIKSGILEGVINIPNELEEGKIISQNIISSNKIQITVNDKNNLSEELTLEITDKTHLSVSTPNNIFQTKKIRPTRKCLFTSSSSSSGEIKDCSSKGSCRGENGEELSCPEGTECSGLPAYGCYPPGCPVPICCSPETKIKTNGEQKRIADIKEGDIVLTDDQKEVKVKKVIKTPVKNHKVLKITLNDTTILEISPGHPTADGRKLKDLKMGDLLDGHVVVETKLIPYIYSHTYDILPDSKTGNYYANGVLIGSTLK